MAKKTAEKVPKKAKKKPVAPGRDPADLVHDEPDAPSSGPRNGRSLVIVESPAKAKTINKYLGDKFVVRASMGHVRDLPSSGMGVDLESFVPEYEILGSKGKVVSELRKLARDSELVYLATDLDREGEAIAWHLKEALHLPDARVKRVIFNAITKAEVQKAFANPMAIDIDRVNAQQARRILDRIVGYEISPLLWRKVARGLSAGRVQSVAVRLIVERDREIDKFVPTEFWRIGAVFTAKGAKVAADLMPQWRALADDAEKTKAEKDKWLASNELFSAELVDFAGEKFSPSDRAVARRIAEALGFAVTAEKATEDAEAKGPAKSLIEYAGVIRNAPPFVVEGIEKKRSQSRPPPPFITSTLQQNASTRLSFGAQRTMSLAQKLYEGGHITYMRTDSTHLSGDAINMARTYVHATFGPKYVPASPNFFSSSNKAAQEAHEAIRPTDITLTPTDARNKLPPDEAKLYALIWTRFVACQMPPAEFDQTAVTIGVATPAGKATFRATGRKLVFDGFMKVSGVSSEDQLLPDLSQGNQVHPVDLAPTQHFTQPPARFTEASLVKELERLGIGRPSTYANIIQTIQDRQYVEQLERRFFSTLLGQIVTDKLIQGFPQILDVQFTAGMELELDKIEEQHLDWVKLLKDFYGPFHESVDAALDKLEHAGGSPSPYSCPKCTKPMLYRISKNGFFLACSDRECKTTQPVDGQGKPMLREVTEFKCPTCGRDMIKRKGRFGEFLGCSGYSVKDEAGNIACSVILNLDKDGNPMPPKPKPISTSIGCDKCGKPMYLRSGKRGPWLGCSGFPKCRGKMAMNKLTPEQTTQINALAPLLEAGSAEAAAMAAKIVAANPVTATPVRPNNIATDIDCEECGKPMIIRNGKRGPFLGCSGYPKCKNTGEVPARLIEELGLAAGSKTPAPQAPEELPAPEDEA